MAKDLTERLAELTENAVGQTSRKDTTLPDSPAPPAIPPRVGQALPRAGGSSSGAIASPISEYDVAQRTYWAERAITSTDGIFVMMIKPIKKIVMKDANEAGVVFNYGDPT